MDIKLYFSHLTYHWPWWSCRTLENIDTFIYVIVYTSLNETHTHTHTHTTLEIQPITYIQTRALMYVVERINMFKLLIRSVYFCQDHNIALVAYRLSGFSWHPIITRKTRWASWARWPPWPRLSRITLNQGEMIQHVLLFRIPYSMNIL